MEFKDIIKTRMTDLNINAEELAKKVGVSPSTIGRYISGEISNVRRDKIAKLANALNIDVAYLMGWQEYPRTARPEFGNHIANVNHLKDKPENLEIYNEICNNKKLRIIMNGVSKLEPDDVEMVTNLIKKLAKEE